MSKKQVTETEAAIKTYRDLGIEAGAGMSDQTNEITAAVSTARKAVEAGHDDAVELLSDAIQLMRPAETRAHALILALDYVSRWKANKDGGAE